MLQVIRRLIRMLRLEIPPAAIYCFKDYFKGEENTYPTLFLNFILYYRAGTIIGEFLGSKLCTLCVDYISKRDGLDFEKALEKFANLSVYDKLEVVDSAIYDKIAPNTTLSDSEIESNSMEVLQRID